eukprot:517339_1
MMTRLMSQSTEEEEARLLDELDYNNGANDAGHFEYRWYVAWYFIMMFFCVVVVVLILTKFALSNPIIPKFIAFVILFAHGAVSSSLLIYAVVLLIVYDIQYFW